MHPFHFVVDLVTDEDLCSAASSLTVTAATANSSPSASSATATTTTADSPQRTKPKPNQDKRAEEELLKANAVLTELSDGPRESIGGIVRTFGDKLVSFRYRIHGLLLISGSRSLLGIWRKSLDAFVVRIVAQDSDFVYCICPWLRDSILYITCCSYLIWMCLDSHIFLPKHQSCNCHQNHW